MAYNHLNMNGRRDRSPLRDRDDRSGGMRGADRDRPPRRFPSDRDRDRDGRPDALPPRDRHSGGASGGSGSGSSGRRGRLDRRVYVSNIPFDFRWQELKDIFRHQVGEVTHVEVFVDDAGKSRGCGIIEFESNELVDLALEKMHRYDLNGRKIVVKEDFGVERDRFGRIMRDGVPRGEMLGGGGGDGGAGAGGGGLGRGPPRGEMPVREPHRGGYPGEPPAGPPVPPEVKYANTYGLNISFLESLGIDGPLVNRVFVANLIYSVDEKQLKEVFGLAGKVVSVSINKDREGNSKGHGVVEFEHPVEAVQAISMLNNQMYMDRVISVRMDRVTDRKERDSGPALPPGLTGLGLGLGSNGKPLADISSKLDSTPAPAPAAAPVTGVAPAQLGGLGGLTANLVAANGAALGLMGAGPAGAAPGFPVSDGSIGGGFPVGMAGVGAAGSGMGLGGLSALGGTAGLGQLTSQAQLSQLGGGLPVGALAGGARLPQMRTDGLAGGDDMRLGGRRGLDSGRPSERSSRTPFPGGYSSGLSSSTDSGYGGGRNFSDSIIVSNLDPNFSWQALRDQFRDVGEVRYADMKGKGVGVVRFSSPHEAQRAISLMDGSRLDGRALDVRSY